MKKIKLGKHQKELLNRTCRTNGGGISVYDCDYKVMRSLEAHGLIQGKLNHDGKFVHTKEGLSLWRDYENV